MQEAIIRPILNTIYLALTFIQKVYFLSLKCNFVKLTLLNIFMLFNCK